MVQGEYHFSDSWFHTVIESTDLIEYTRPMILLLSIAYADSIMVLEPSLVGAPTDTLDVSIYSEHVRHVLGKNIPSDWDVLTKAQMHHLISESDVDLLSAVPIDIAKSVGADWLVTTELFQSPHQKGMQIWFRSVETDKVVHEARLMSDDWAELHTTIGTDWKSVLPKEWGASVVPLTITPMHNELYGCVHKSIINDISEPILVIDAKPSPTSSVYMPSAIGTIRWMVSGTQQHVTWTSFGATQDGAIENATSLQQLKGTSVEEICQSIIQQTTQVKGK